MAGEREQHHLAAMADGLRDRWPVLCCLLAVVADAAGYRTAMLTTAAAIGLLLWSLLTVGGLGLLFLGPAILLAAAAASSWQQERRTRRATTGSPTKTPV